MKTEEFEAKVSESLSCLIEYGDEDCVTEEEVEAWKSFQKEVESAAKNCAPNFSHGSYQIVTNTDGESYFGFSRCDILNLMSDCNQLIFTAFYREEI